MQPQQLASRGRALLVLLLDGLLFPVYLYLQPEAFKSAVQRRRISDARLRNVVGISALWLPFAATIACAITPGHVQLVTFYEMWAVLGVGLAMAWSYSLYTWGANPAQGAAVAVAAHLLLAWGVCVYLPTLDGIANSLRLPVLDVVTAGLNTRPLALLLGLGFGMIVPVLVGVWSSVREAFNIGLAGSVLFVGVAITHPNPPSCLDFILGGAVYILTFSHLYLLPLNVGIDLLTRLFAGLCPGRFAILWYLSPVRWDEFVFWPLPGLSDLLIRLVQTDGALGRQAIAHVSQHPFQRRVAQAAAVRLGWFSAPASRPQPTRHELRSARRNSFRRGTTRQAVILLCTTLAAGTFIGLLSLVATWLLNWSVLLPLLAGGLGGGVFALAYWKSRIRHVLIAGFISVLMGLAIYGVKQGLFALISTRLSPDATAQLSGGSPSANPALPIILTVDELLLEGVITVGTCLSIGLLGAQRPFCEHCRAYYGDVWTRNGVRGQVIGRVNANQVGRFLGPIRLGDFVRANALLYPTSPVAGDLAVWAERCPSCTEGPVWVTVVQTVGPTSPRRILLLQQMISNEQFRSLTEIPNTPVWPTDE